MKIYRSSILVIFASVVASQNSQYTIESVAEYSLQRACVQTCVGPDLDGLPQNIGCPYPYLNDCACRTDLQLSASTFLTQCVDQWCSSDPSDFSSAISLYDSYCVSNRFPIVTAPISTPATTSYVTIPAAVSTATAPTATATSSSTSLTTSSSELLLTFILLSTILVHHLL
jgi:hypothetical protein